MQSKGLDCATPLTAELAAAFAADGHTFVGRYLVPARYSKALTRTEAELISAAGLSIVSVFETTADRALGGYEAGTADGKTALACAVDVGQPEGSTIYFAVDFDAQPWQMPKVIDYLHGCGLAAPGYEIGVYGSYAVVGAVRAAGVCQRFWQTYAWSRGQQAEGIHIYQWENDVWEYGIKIDRNEGFGDFGGWSIEQALKYETEDEENMNELQLTTEGWGYAGDVAPKGVRKRIAWRLYLCRKGI
jgi:hypothetical protein